MRKLHPELGVDPRYPEFWSVKLHSIVGIWQISNPPRRDYLADPTIHLIWILNPKLLAARRSAIQKLGQKMLEGQWICHWISIRSLNMFKIFSITSVLQPLHLCIHFVFICISCFFRRLFRILNVVDVFRKSRPSWDKPPTEEDGDVATEEQIKSLHQVLLKDASQGPSHFLQMSWNHPAICHSKYSRSEMRHPLLMGFWWLCHGELCVFGSVTPGGGPRGGYGLDEEELRGVKGLETELHRFFQLQNHGAQNFQSFF